jgi:DNA helicase-2/ATP-dependent DNA helicase PcrA
LLSGLRPPSGSAGVALDVGPVTDYTGSIMEHTETRMQTSRETRSSSRADALLAGLTEQQREAVTHAEGPLLVLAGAGSGKTRVITRRAAYLGSTVTKPWHVLAITFTNKAANEMRERMAALGVGSGMPVSTFHAFCARSLRIYHDRAGLPAGFSIFDQDDRRKAIAKAVETCGMNPKNWPAGQVEPKISEAKNRLETAAAFAERETGDWRHRHLADIYEAYEAILAEMGGLDFDDLLMRMAVLLRDDAELRAELEDRHRFVLVDEYQDTNGAQYALARLLTREHENLCATGDPDQSIYGWRGADMENILSFEKDFPQAKVVLLEQNYRSTKRILAAADALIEGNQRRKAKGLWTENEEGAPIRLVECEDADAEARSVARDIKEQLASGVPAEEIAIFYRTNALSRSVEEALLKAGIAYQVARGVAFYNRREIKDVISYLRVLINPADDISLLRVVNTPPRGIGDTTVKRIQERAQTLQCRLLEVLQQPDEVERLGRSAARVQAFAELMEGLKVALEMSPPEALRYVLSHSGLHAHYAGEERPAGEGPIANLDELISAAAKFEAEQPESSLVDWLEYAALAGDVDGLSDAGGVVTMMTLHAAKGLEFDVVYVLGLEDGLLPFLREDDLRAADEEEERRLCFVGITRAKKRLTMTWARFRMLRGVTQRTIRSRFIDELPRKHVQLLGLAPGEVSVGGWRSRSTGEVAGNSGGASGSGGSVGLSGAFSGGGGAGGDQGDPGLFRRPPSQRPAWAEGESAAGSGETPRGQLPGDVEQWAVGTLVRHPKRGIGRLLSIERGGKRTHVKVQFQDGSEQAWVLEFANLTRVDFDEVGDLD